MDGHPGENGRVVAILLDKISPNPHQPRERFDQAKLEELASSIRDKGVLQPVIVRLLSESDGTYELVMGERRLRACKSLGLESIPAIVREYTPEESWELALIENLQRDDLTVMEEARSVSGLMEKYDSSRQRVAERIGKSVQYVADCLALLTLPAEVQSLLDEGKINAAQAKVILDLDGEEHQVKAAKLAVKLNLSANELKGRTQHQQKPADGEKTASQSGTTFSQLTGLLVRLYDALEGYEYGKLRDANKRTTLKKQIVLIQGTLSEAVEQLEQEAGELESETAESTEAVA